MSFIKWLFGIKDKQPASTVTTTRPRATANVVNKPQSGAHPPATSYKRTAQPIVKKKTVTRTNTRTVYNYNNNNYYYDYDGCLIDVLGNLIEDAILMGCIMDNNNVVPDYNFPQEVVYEQPVQFEPQPEQPVYSGECYPYTPEASPIQNDDGIPDPQYQQPADQQVYSVEEETPAPQQEEEEDEQSNSQSSVVEEEDNSTSDSDDSDDSDD